MAASQGLSTQIAASRLSARRAGGVGADPAAPTANHDDLGAVGLPPPRALGRGDGDAQPHPEREADIRVNDMAAMTDARICVARLLYRSKWRESLT